MDYMLEVLKCKDLNELKRVAHLVELVERWKRNPVLYREPIYQNGNLTFKDTPKDLKEKRAISDG